MEEGRPGGKLVKCLSDKVSNLASLVPKHAQCLSLAVQKSLFIYSHTKRAWERTKLLILQCRVLLVGGVCG